jgi:hypothetical protein
MADDLLPIVRVNEWKMRAMFNRGQYWEKTRTGELAEHRRRHIHLSLENAQKANEPYCTHSQQVSYMDRNNTEIVRVHQYLRPTGELGGKGKPDPKRMLENGVLYRLRELRWYERAYALPRKLFVKVFGI